MPIEFWREVVDRVAAEAPDTLLLAEAFWMMEGYFVRTLGMHRVYNSAFMNMLAREANDDYQRLIRNVLAFDPKILARFVNFMNNPDEETAIAQFGDGDKAYGVATLMATLPGLPMFGHGQVEGLREKYGMEYRRPKWDERPNDGMVARHLREIAPLLRRRPEFAGTDRFRLLEVEDDGGHALPDVFAYVNGRPGGPANLVLYHNRYAEAHGVVRRSAPFADGDGDTRRVGLAEALGLQGGADRFVRYRDLTDGLVYLARSDALRSGGLPVRLGAYGKRVLVDLVEERDVDGRLERLHRHLAGRGVSDLGEALVALQLAPLHEAFASLLRSRPRGEAAPQGAAADATATEAGAPGEASPPDAEVGPPTRQEPPEHGAEADTAPRSQRAGRTAAAGVEAGAPGGPDEAALRGFLQALEEAAPDERLDLATLRRRWRRVREGATAPGPGWRRAWAVASAFDHPAEVARRLRLDVALAERILSGGEADPLGVGPEGWASLWRAMLPVRRRPDLAQASADAAAPADAAGRPGTPGGAGDREATAAAASSVRPEAAPRDPAAAALAELQRDAGLQRVLGVHHHDGVRWFRREGFRAWLGAWAAVRKLRGEPEARLAGWVAELEAAEARSGYRFERLDAPASPAGDETADGAEADGREHGATTAAEAREDAPCDPDRADGSPERDA
jgi:hypothetical protein